MPLTTTRVMGIEVTAMLCDSAAAEAGKLYVQGGGWNNITVAAFPAQHPRIGIALVVTVPYTQTNKPHALTIELQDEDGKAYPLGPGDPGSEKLTAQFNVGRPPQLVEGEAQMLSLAVNLDGLVFDRPGLFSFVISVNKEERSRLTFRVLSPTTIQLSA